MKLREKIQKRKELKEYRRKLDTKVHKHEEEYVYYAEHEGLGIGITGLIFYSIGKNLPAIVEAMERVDKDFTVINALSDTELMMLLFGVGFKLIGGIFIFYFISCLFNRLSYDIDL